MLSAGFSLYSSNTVLVSVPTEGIAMQNFDVKSCIPVLQLYMLQTSYTEHVSMLVYAVLLLLLLIVIIVQSVEGEFHLLTTV